MNIVRHALLAWHLNGLYSRYTEYALLIDFGEAEIDTEFYTDSAKPTICFKLAVN